MTAVPGGQAHYPGYYWSATASGHVIYESRLELTCLLLWPTSTLPAARMADPAVAEALAWPDELFEVRG
jgi:hypothetical protein